MHPSISMLVPCSFAVRVSFLRVEGACADGRIVVVALGVENAVALMSAVQEHL